MSIFDKKSGNSRKSHTILSTLKNSESGRFLVWKLPEEDFNDKSILIVNPGEEAIFVNNGVIVQTFINGRYELSSETFYNLSINMSDLSRRFEAEILVDISGQKNVSSADIGLADLDSAVEIVPLDRGLGVVYSNEELGEVTLVA